MKHPLLIGWHLGLGDAIICNGLVRELAKEREHVYLPVKQCNKWSVQDMFSDLENVSQIVVPNSIDWKNLAMMASTLDAEYKGLGCYGTGPFDSTIFDQEFYRQAEVDFEKRWSAFKAGRTGDAFPWWSDGRFVHDDPERGFVITKIPAPEEGKLHTAVDYPVFKAPIVDYIEVMKRSKEIHCIDSCFALLADSIKQLKDKPKFIHRYARPNAVYPTYRNNWEILT